MINARRSVISLIVLLTSMATNAHSQSAGAGTITGTITDTTGRLIPTVAIVLSNVDTSVNRSTSTNGAGIYSIPFLPPGRYEISASKQGFTQISRKGLVLEVGRTLDIDFVLTVQGRIENVVVSIDQVSIDREKTEVSQVVSESAIESLPIAGRRWDSFVLLTPNVTTDGGTGLVSFRGISGLYNENLVDGANNNQAFFSEARGRTNVPYVYSMDSIQEFQVSSSNYSAELGQATGGVVNAVTKSGTNTFCGDLFYYLRYPSLNALDPIGKSRGIYTQPVHQQQQFGGSLGGPIIKEKLFYFLTYDGSRNINPISYTSSSTFPQICSPTIPSLACMAANSFVVAQLGAFPRKQNQDVFFEKVNYQVTPANQIEASFDFNNFYAPNSYRTLPTQNNESVTANGNATTHERIFVINWNSTISSAAVNDLRFQWSRDLEAIAANSTGPNVGIANVMTYGLSNSLPRAAFPDEHRLQFSDALSMIRGRHILRTGVDINAVHELIVNLFQGGGVYGYSGGGAFSNWVADTLGINLGDGLTGRHFNTFVQATDPTTGLGKDDFYDNDLDAYVEDHWRILPNLTLNLGVRYDIQLIPAPSQPNLATPLTRLYTSTINIDKNNIAPRLGLAWQVMKSTTFRVGYGIFYGKTSNSTFYATRVENGVIQQTFNCNPTTCPLLVFPNLIYPPPGAPPASPFPGAVTPTVTPFVPPSGTQTSRGQSPQWVNPLVHEGEIMLERRLFGSINVSAGYLFSRGLRLPVFVDANLAPATLSRTFDVTSSTGVTASTLTLPFYNSRIDPTGPILTGYSDVNSWYNSFILTVHRTMSKGAEFTVNYTLSKSTDGGQVSGQFGTFNGTDSPIDPRNRKLEYGTSDLNQTHRVVANAVWTPSFTAALASRPARTIFDGFTFSAIVTVSTGQPVTGTINGSTVGGPAGGLTGAVVNNAGTALSSSRFPGEPRNAHSGPNFANIDFRAGRSLTFREHYKISLTAEAFNLTNSTNILSVNTTEYNYNASGSGVCSGHSNNCVSLNPAFFAATASSNGLYGARQLQLSGRFSF